MIRGSRHQINLTAIGVRCWNMKSSSYPLGSWLGQCCPLWGRLGRWLCLCRRKRPRVQGEEPYAQLLVQESPGAVDCREAQGRWEDQATSRFAAEGIDQAAANGVAPTRRYYMACAVPVCPLLEVRLPQPWLERRPRTPDELAPPYAVSPTEEEEIFLIKSPIRISKNLKILCSYMPYLLQIVHTTEFFTIGRAAKATPPGQSWSRVISQ